MAKPETSQEAASDGGEGREGGAGLLRPPRREAKRAAATQLAAAQAVRARRARRAAAPLAVVWRPLAALTPNPRNARAHSAQQIAGIAESIAAFGFNAPILIDGAGVVLAGHGRLLAAQSLGLTEAPTIAVKHLNAAERRAFMIADNRLSDRSGWDEERLAFELKALKTLDLDFALTATGFDLDEIDLRIGTQASANTPRSDEGAAGPAGRRGRGAGNGAGEASRREFAQEPGRNRETGADAGRRVLPRRTHEVRTPGGGVAQTAAARPGDVWALGPHLLLCADDGDGADPAAMAAIDAAISAWEEAMGESARLDPTQEPFETIARVWRASLDH